MLSRVQPLRVYLDTSDYSGMSERGPKGAAAAHIRDQLREWVREGVITCHFSGTLLCEIAPLGSGATEAAQRRADLVAELCGQHAMISQDRLVDAEIRFATGESMRPPVAHSESAEWYPAGSDEILLPQFTRVQDEVENILSEEPMNRAQRRAARRKVLTKNGRIRPTIVGSMLKSAEAVLAQFPFHDDGAETMRRFVQGKATQQELAALFVKSLRDPRWLMLWFARQPDMATPFTRWVRAPGEHLASLADGMKDQVARLRAIDQMNGTRYSAEILSSQSWKDRCDQRLVEIATRIAHEALGLEDARVTLDGIERDCPGLSTCVRAIHAAWWQSMQAHPRSPSQSDFPDALHAMYAPYVDVFRADRFMAPHIRGLIATSGTTVVSKLSDLVPVVESRLAERRA